MRSGCGSSRSIAGQNAGFCEPRSMAAAGSGSQLAGASDDVLVARQLFNADRTACMELVSRDADLRAHAEFTAVRKLSGSVVKHNRTVHTRKEALRSRV